MDSATVGIYRETAPAERRVALVPEAVPAVRDLGFQVLVEFGAGQMAGYADERYAEVGAHLVAGADLVATADILVGVRPPNIPLAHGLRPGQVLLCLLQPVQIPHLIRRWADNGLTAIAVDLLPATFAPLPPVDACSAAYAETIVALLRHLVRDATVTIDLDDPLQAAIVVTRHRQVVNAAVWKVILSEIRLAGLP